MLIEANNPSIPAIDFTENQTTQGDMKQYVEPLPHWESPCFWFSFVIVLYRFILHHIPHLFPIGADGAFFRVKNREQGAAKEAPVRLSGPCYFRASRAFTAWSAMSSVTWV